MNKKFYKVLKQGKSFHGGEFSWSLPTEDQPGDWHTVKGELKLCDNGLHLTSNPAKWWDQDAECFEAEIEGDIVADDSDKIACRKVRLLRKLSAEELAQFQIFYSGEHTVEEGSCLAYGNSTVMAFGKSTVIAYDNSIVEAYDNSTVKAYNNSTVEASNRSTVGAYHNSTVRAYDRSNVIARNNSTVLAYNNSNVMAYHSSTVGAYHNSTVWAYNNSTVKAYNNSIVWAYNNSIVRAYGNSTVRACNSSTVEANGSSTVKAYNSSTVTIPKYYGTTGAVTIEDEAVLIDRLKSIFKNRKTEFSWGEDDRS